MHAAGQRIRHSCALFSAVLKVFLKINDFLVGNRGPGGKQRKPTAGFMASSMIIILHFVLSENYL